MNKELPLAKLPKWAQEHIKTLDMQREAAVTALKDFEDSQSESPVFYELHPCIGEEPGPSFIRSYIQSDTINFNYAGVDLRVSLWRDEISISYSGVDNREDVAMVPFGYSQVKLVTKKQLR